MPRFIFIEQRDEQYEAVAEAKDLAAAKKLYDDDDESAFGDHWEQTGSDNAELREIIELDENGEAVAHYIYENGELQDEIEDACLWCSQPWKRHTEEQKTACRESLRTSIKKAVEANTPTDQKKRDRDRPGRRKS